MKLNLRKELNLGTNVSIGGKGGTLSQRSRNRRKSDRIRVAQTPDRILCTTCVYHLFWASQTTENPEQPQRHDGLCAMKWSFAVVSLLS
jgi:hypothetical protein